MPIWMVVEDEPDVYQILMAMFELWGIEGLAFTNGHEALIWIEAVDRGWGGVELPDLVLLDIRLPGGSGTVVGSRLRQSSRLSNMAIVLMTAYRLNPDEESATINLAQADALVYKPLPAMDELKTLLEHFIDQRKMQLSG